MDEREELLKLINRLEHKRDSFALAETIFFGLAFVMFILILFKHA